MVNLIVLQFATCVYCLQVDFKLFIDVKATQCNYSTIERIPVKN